MSFPSPILLVHHSKWLAFPWSGHSVLFDHHLPEILSLTFFFFPWVPFFLGILSLFYNSVDTLWLFNITIYLNRQKTPNSTSQNTKNSNDLWTSEILNLNSNWVNTNSDHNHSTPVRMTTKKWKLWFHSVGEAVER